MRSGYDHPAYLRRVTLGFSLIELMTTVAILGLLSAAAVPSFIEFTKTQKMKAMSSEIHMSLIRARSEAIKRNQNVTISPTVADDWLSGWSIPDPDNVGTNIDVHSPISGITITGPSSVIYTSSGRISGATAASFEFGAAGSSARKCVIVDLTGRPYVKATAC